MKYIFKFDTDKEMVASISNAADAMIHSFIGKLNINDKNMKRNVKNHDNNITSNVFFVVNFWYKNGRSIAKKRSAVIKIRLKNICMRNPVMRIIDTLGVNRITIHVIHSNMCMICKFIVNLCEFLKRKLFVIIMKTKSERLVHKHNIACIKKAISVPSRGNSALAGIAVSSNVLFKFMLIDVFIIFIRLTLVACSN